MKHIFKWAGELVNDSNGSDVQKTAHVPCIVIADPPGCNGRPSPVADEPLPVTQFAADEEEGSFPLPDPAAFFVDMLLLLLGAAGDESQRDELACGSTYCMHAATINHRAKLQK